ncbi:hypothetical protein H0H92_005031 [Tricholoma furcatifolium]|nr:hypothetical protein H0H92_005031 [Tricholoma furcatifolium]
MDSQLTLMNPTVLQLDFSKNSMLNAVLTSRGSPLYVISTVDTAGSHTDVKDAATKKILAVIKRKIFLSDTVTFTNHHGGKTLKMEKWLSNVKLLDGSAGIQFETGTGTKYVWKEHELHRIALYRESDFDHPLAYEVVQTNSPPSLMMDSGMEAFRDQILVSFLLIEQRLRMATKAQDISFAQEATGAFTWMINAGAFR